MFLSHSPISSTVSSFFRIFLHLFLRSPSSSIYLEGIRRGQIDRDNKNFERLINGTISVNDVSDEIDHETRLFRRTNDVKRVNQERLKSLGKEVVRWCGNKRRWRTVNMGQFHLNVECDFPTN